MLMGSSFHSIYTYLTTALHDMVTLLLALRSFAACANNIHCMGCKHTLY